MPKNPNRELWWLLRDATSNDFAICERLYKDAHVPNDGEPALLEHYAIFPSLAESFIKLAEHLKAHPELWIEDLAGYYQSINQFTQK